MKFSAILLAMLVLLNSCTNLVEPEHHSYNARQILNETTTLIRNTYPFIQFKSINVDSLHDVFAENMSYYEQGDNVFEMLGQYLGNLKDGHVWFYSPSGVGIKPYYSPKSLKDRHAYSPEVVRVNLNMALNLTPSQNIEYGITEDNIGYIYISTMLRGNGNWIYEFDQINTEFENVDGVIIDVRNNGGGNTDVNEHFFSFFISEPFPSPPFFDPEGTELPNHYIQPNPKSKIKNKPVVLLQNGGCFSSTENFINKMHELQNVTAIGDTTGGGSGVPLDFELHQGFIIRLSTQAELTYEYKHIEWNGLVPDILVPQTKADIDAGRDLQLEAAVAYLSGEQVIMSKAEVEENY
jgi:hypothetical protein